MRQITEIPGTFSGNSALLRFLEIFYSSLFIVFSEERIFLWL